ncbi:MAG: cytochrome c-type biogenesis protein [Candidatus Tokpelaia sp. JSC189]|nr:MAG: cytochrome c-type biogenesis protein [Candidatus Tokpelaia sp. JSC189]
MVEISWLGAIGAGALSFFSPCVLPLVPPYLCYMAGVSIEDFYAVVEKENCRQGARWTLVIAAIFFALGFTTVFVALGAVATTIGSFLLHWQQQIAGIAGIIIILMGLNFLGTMSLSFLSREVRFQMRGISAGPAGAFIIGLAFAFGWTPCIGPILGSILTLAASKRTIAEGTGLLAVYSLGFSIPFILTAIFSAGFMRLLSRLRMHLDKIKKIIGILLVITGILFLFGQMQNISYWFLEWLSVLKLDMMFMYSENQK